MTLACEDGRQVGAHKVVLIAPSTFFEKILIRNQHPHPLIYIKGGDGELQIYVCRGQTKLWYGFYPPRDLRLILPMGNRRFFISGGQIKPCHRKTYVSRGTYCLACITDGESQILHLSRSNQPEPLLGWYGFVPRET